MPTPDVIVVAARRFLGTPYHHQAALAGAGCDCLGLVRGVWRELFGAEPEAPPPYTPDWGEVGEAEPILEAARRHMIERPIDVAGAGDLVVFRMRFNAVAKHAAILSGPTRMIHARSNDQVREEAVTAAWRARMVAAFAFPEHP